MKTKIKSLAIFLTLAGLQAQAQVSPQFTAPISTPTGLEVGTQINSGAVTIGSVDETVLFYNPATDGPSLTLNASLTDGGTPAITFDSYVWYRMTFSGGNEVEGTALGTTTNQLSLSALDPGYHKYRVYGVADTGDVSCQSDDYEEIIFFVLPPLEITASLNGGTETEYCANDLPANGALEFTSSVAYDGDYALNNTGYTNPGAADFVYKYRWYAINSEDPGTEINLTGSGNDPDVSTPDTASADFFDTAGTYTFFVQVEYAVKDKGAREYVTYSAQVLDGGDPVTVVVYPVPQAPTITVTGVTD